MRAFDAVSSDITGSMGPPTVNRTVAMRNRESGPLSLEEIGLGVTGVAAGMRAPASDSNVDLTLEGSPDEDNGAAAAIYSLEAAVECMERSARTGLVALPKAEFHGRTTWYALSDTTRKIKEDQRKRVTQLAVEGKKQSRQDLKTYQSDFCASCKADKKAFVTDIAEQIEEASKVGDPKELNKQKKRLSRGKGGNKGKPTVDANGNKFSSIEELLKWWHTWVEDHWKMIEVEEARP